MSPAVLLACVALLAVIAGACGGDARTATTVTAPTSIRCALSVSPEPASVPAIGGTGQLVVNTTRDCTWTASVTASWLSLAEVNGQGEARVQYSAAANPDPVTRTAAVVFNDQRAEIVQGAAECGFELGAGATNFPRTGGRAQIDVLASSALCEWRASTDADWILLGSTSGRGTSALPFEVVSTTGPPRTGTITVAGLRYGITQAEGCTYAIVPASQAIGSSGGTGTIAVTASVGCPWTAASSAPWLSITGGTSGSGNGVVSFQAAATDGPGRTGTISVAGQVFTLSQGAGCSLSVSPTSHTAGASGGVLTVSVRGAQGCPWTAQSHDGWIAVTAGASGDGDGAVTLQIAASSGPARAGRVTVAGQAVTISQAAGCTYEVAPASLDVPSSGGFVTTNVTAPAGCGWSASSAADWIAIEEGASGSGSGSVRLRVAASDGAARSGTVTVAGRTVTVQQANACTFAVSPSSHQVPAGGGSVSFSVTAGGGCSWTASSGADWLRVDSGGSGSGAGTVVVTAQPNAGGSRSGTLTIAGHEVSVTQEGGCSFALSPAAANVPAAGGAGSFSVTTGTGCSWAASSDAPWIAITSGGSGTGPGQVTFDVAANPGPARTGAITAAGQAFTIQQEGAPVACTFAVEPQSMTIGAGGGVREVAVSAPAGCAWTAVSHVNWIVIQSGASGTGSGTVSFEVGRNVQMPRRTGTLTVAGHTVTIEQN